MPDFDRLILEQNPWWQAGYDPATDPHIQSFRESPFTWDPAVLSILPLKPGATHTLRGPRQVGKTTTVKRLIERLVRQGERRILYFSFDLAREPEDIVDVIRRAKVLHPDPKGPWYLFCDEVTAIPQWGLGVKYAWDQGMTRGDFLLLTGSSARDLVTNTERLPGRRGVGFHDYLQLPLTFRDFCQQVRHIALPEAVDTISALLTPATEKLMRTLLPLRDQLLMTLNTYASIGGFPLALRAYAQQRTEQVEPVPAPEAVHALWAAIAADVQRTGHDAVAALKFLEETGVSLGTPLRWTNIAQAMDVASPKTAKNYATLLTESFTVLMVYHWDIGEGGFEPQKMRKVYFIDPLVAAVPPLRIPGARIAPRDGMMENLMAVQLFRTATAQLRHADPVPGSIAFWRSRNDREIDFLVTTPDLDVRTQRLPIEVKGDNLTNLSHARRSIHERFGKGLVTTRTVLDWQTDIPAAPLAFVLALLRDHPTRLD